LQNTIKEKSFRFAIRIINLYKFIKKQKEFVLSKQVLRSGTAIGALIKEAEFAQSRADFINKMQIALKEANETSYWIDLLFNTNYIDKKMHKSIDKDIKEIISILVKIVKNTKNSCESNT